MKLKSTVKLITLVVVFVAGQVYPMEKEEKPMCKENDKVALIIKSGKFEELAAFLEEHGGLNDYLKIIGDGPVEEKTIDSEKSKTGNGEKPKEKKKKKKEEGKSGTVRLIRTVPLLVWAVECGQYKIVDCLLEREGLMFKNPDSEGKNALQVAQKKVEAMMENKEDISKPNDPVKILFRLLNFWKRHELRNTSFLFDSQDANLDSQPQNNSGSGQKDSFAMLRKSNFLNTYHHESTLSNVMGESYDNINNLKLFEEITTIMQEGKIEALKEKLKSVKINSLFSIGTLEKPVHLGLLHIAVGIAKNTDLRKNKTILKIIKRLIESDINIDMTNENGQTAFETAPNILSLLLKKNKREESSLESGVWEDLDLGENDLEKRVILVERTVEIIKKDDKAPKEPNQFLSQNLTAENKEDVARFDDLFKKSLPSEEELQKEKEKKDQEELERKRKELEAEEKRLEVDRKKNELDAKKKREEEEALRNKAIELEKERKAFEESEKNFKEEKEAREKLERELKEKKAKADKEADERKKKFEQDKKDYDEGEKGCLVM